MRLAGFARMLVLALLWGSNFLWISYALDGFSPLAVTALRLGLGAIVLVVVVRARGLRFPIDRATWLHLTVAAVFGNSIPYWLFAQAEQTTPSSLTGAVNATTPLWALAIAAALRADRPLTPMRVTGVLVGFAGTAVLLAPWNTTGAGTGALLALAASACYGLSFAYMARYLVPRALPPVVLAAAQLVVATIPVALLAPLGPTPIDQPTGRAMLSLLVLGALGTGLAYVLNYLIIAEDGPVVAAAVTYLLPVVAITLGLAFNDEPATWSLLAGSAIVVVGVVLTRAAGPRQDHAHTPTTT